MTGIEMALKAMGVDPEKIKAEMKQTLEGVTKSVQAEVNTIKETQTRIEMKLDSLIAWHLARNPEVDSEPNDKIESGMLDSDNIPIRS